MMRDFRELKVWGKAHSFTLDVYRETESFPKHELYGLAAQLRRAASSVAINISEGAGANSNAEFARFLQMALNSASEVEYELLLARDLAYLRQPLYDKLAVDITEIKKMLTGFIQHLHGRAAGAQS